MFENFTAFNFNEGIPSISVTKNGLTFSKGVVMKMGYPEYVQLLINKPERQIAAEKRANCGIISIRWNQKDLLNTIANMMEWNLKDASYKIEGVFYASENAVLFDMNNATILK